MFPTMFKPKQMFQIMFFKSIFLLHFVISTYMMAVMISDLRYRIVVTKWMDGIITAISIES